MNIGYLFCKPDPLRVECSMAYATSLYPGRIECKQQEKQNVDDSKLVVVFGSLMAMTASGSDYSDLKVQPGEWRTLAPGQPRAKFPTVRVIEEGKGPVVELGHLVKLNVRNK